MAAGACSDVLTRAGFNLRHAFELDPDDRSPVILGDVHGALGSRARPWKKAATC